jgi:hypothetical protein
MKIGTDYRYPDIAEWKSNIITEDGEQMRPSTSPIKFKCCVFNGGSKMKVSLIEGAEISGSSIAIRTPDKRLKDAEADDLIIYKGQEYTLESVGELTSMSFLNAKEYVLYLR